MIDVIQPSPPDVPHGFKPRPWLAVASVAPWESAQWVSSRNDSTCTWALKMDGFFWERRNRESYRKSIRGFQEYHKNGAGLPARFPCDFACKQNRFHQFRDGSTIIVRKKTMNHSESVTTSNTSAVDVKVVRCRCQDNPKNQDTGSLEVSWRD